MKIILTCEHGGNEIPSDFTFVFDGKQEILSSHRGWDLGVLEVFNYLKTEAVFSEYSTTSRLLIEKNRSLHHKQLFSEITQTLPISVKQTIIEKHYLLYRNSIENKIKEYIASGEEVLHVSLHSFTPVLNGKTRNTDIGFLYDPQKNREWFWVQQMKQNLSSFTSWKIRFNYPYLGASDGFTTYLRKKIPNHYSGIEIEINQGLLIDGGFPLQLKKDLKKMLQQL